MAVMIDTAALEGFDALPAGPALAAALEEVDPATLIGEDAAAWMRAGFRQRNHADWLLLRAIREACSARAGTTMRVEDDEFAPKIAAANLGWSTTTAATRLDLAVGILERMPALGERLRTGSLELAKATAFVTGLEGLGEAQCAEVLARLLDEAPDLPLGQLRDRILDAGYAVDRVWGANRLAAATARARVTRETAPSGAVNLCGRDLPPELAQDAAAWLRTLALAVRARLRAAGRKVALGFIEARVFVRLMDGTQAGALDSDIITAVTAELTATGTPDGGPDDGGPDDDGPGDGGPDDDGPHDNEPDDNEPDDNEPDDNGPDDDGPDDGGPDDGGPGDGGPGDNGSDGGPEDGGPDDRDAPDDPGPGPDRSDDEDDDGPTPGASDARESSVVFAPGVALRLSLSTLLGLDDQPAALPGTGPVPADTARAAARGYGAATWQILVHDERSHLQHLLVMRAPPDAIRDPRHRRQTVQVTAPAGLIHALAPTGLEDTEAAGAPGGRCVLFDEATTTWLQHAHDALVRSENADPEDHPATTTRDRDRRFPGAALARWVAARDQTCIALGCRRPAEACDVDHTLDRTLGGPTQAGDLDLLCRHDHRAKHEGGWHYEQPEPGRFVITDPTGTRHHVESRVVHPRPAPIDPGHGISPDAGEPRPRPDWAPNRTRDGRITPEARATAGHLASRARAQEEVPPGRYDTDPDF